MDLRSSHPTRRCPKNQHGRVLCNHGRTHRALTLPGRCATVAEPAPRPQEATMNLSRRTALRLGGAALAAGLTDLAHAAEPVIATTYPGSFDEAFKAVVGPAFAKATGASVNFTPLLNVDQIGKIQAARANPPFDVVLFDEGPLINAKKADVLDKFPASASKALADIPDAFKHPDGYAPVITCQVIGIAFNPKKVKAPPTSWDDLW